MDRDGTQREPGRFVLVVDDDVTVRESVREVLALLDTPTIGAGNGLEAMDAIARIGTPAGVVTDLHMPGLDGIGLIRELRALPAMRSIPILLLSGESVVAQLPAGVAFTYKPASLAALQSFVEQLGQTEVQRTGDPPVAGDRRSPTVVVNPASDQVFAEFTGMLVDHGATATVELEQRLRAVYPNATVHARRLDAAPWLVWYVHREGAPDSENDTVRGGQQANVEHE